MDQELTSRHEETNGVGTADAPADVTNVGRAYHMRRTCNIIVDSPADFSPAVAERLGVRVIPFSYVDEDGNEHYDDLWKSQDPHEFYERMRKNPEARYTTAAVTPGRYMEIFAEAAKEGLPILYLGFTRGLSSSIESAQQAADTLMAQDHSLKIYVLDNLCPSASAELLAIEVVRQAANGLTAEELAVIFKNNAESGEQKYYSASVYNGTTYLAEKAPIGEDGSIALTTAPVDGTEYTVEIIQTNTKKEEDAVFVSLTVTYTAPKSTFEDVAADDYFFEPVEWAAESGITSGTTETTFSPNDTCTRAQMVTFLWRAAGKPESSMTNPFSDVSEDAYYYQAVLWAAEQGITKGTSDTTFSPNDEVLRCQAVTFLYRMKGSPATTMDNPFTDVTENSYFYEAVLWAVSEEITLGYGDGIFAPLDNCLRCQIVTFLYRCLAD